MENKLASARNHTATHLLQAALKRVVGDHINQAGSAVNAHHLRFDFSSFEPISAEQLQQVEEMVNAEILTGKDVEISHMNQEDAKKLVLWHYSVKIWRYRSCSYCTWI